MHNVSKKPLTDDQKEAKRVERQKKQERFLKARHLILKKNQQGQFDDEGLKVTGAVLAANPDLYVFWNYRKRTILTIKERNDEHLETYYRNELSLTEECLRDNPKSYGAWYHRQWILQKLFKHSSSVAEILKSELRHCTEALRHDERNFHCWDHRRFVCKLGSVSEMDELKFTKDKIDENFSNYSAWHYRSSLLPRLFPPSDADSILRLEESKLKEELTYASNAFFTDPEDQSAWFYNCWLFRPVHGNLGENIRVRYFCFNPNDPACIILGFSRSVKLDNLRLLRIAANGVDIPVSDWSTPDGSRSCSIWMSYSIPDIARSSLGETSMLKIFVGDDAVGEFEISGTDSRLEWTEPDRLTSVLQPKLPSAFREALETTMNACRELKSIEPSSNKWPSLMEILSMRSLDLLRHETVIIAGLDSLAQVDVMKRNYYEDLKSKFIIHAYLLKQTTAANGIRRMNLASVDLTSFPILTTTSLIIGVTELNLNNNRLRSTRPLGYLLNLVRLSLNENQLAGTDGLNTLLHLEYLSLASNLLGPDCERSLAPLKGCVNLRELILTGNLLCENETVDSLSEFLGKDCGGMMVAL